MQRKIGKHPPLAAALPPQIGRNPRLERLAQLFDWERVGAVVQDIYAAPTGRPSYPPLMLVKVLLLQQWYAASDPDPPRCVTACPSAGSSVWGWRTRAPPLRHDQSLPPAVDRPRAGRGVVRGGQSPVGGPRTGGQGRHVAGRDVGASPGAPAHGDGPAGGQESDRSGRRLVRPGGQAHFGYKLHLGVDAGSGLIRTACLTAAQIAESTVADTLILGDEAAVYADRAYESKPRRQRLKAAGIKDRIMHRSHKYQARLPYWPRQRNRLIARVRAPVEQVFGTLKRLYRYRRVRYLGLARNATELWCKCLAYNLRRAERLLHRLEPGVVVP